MRAISRMLLPCRLKTRISTASSTTNMALPPWGYSMSGWVNFQSATWVSFAPAATRARTEGVWRPATPHFFEATNVDFLSLEFKFQIWGLNSHFYGMREKATMQQAEIKE